MRKLMPQEVEVWYVLPALRKEIAKILVKKGLSQKKIAETFGVSAPSITHYTKSQRGCKTKFSRADMKEINKGAKRIFEGENAEKVLYDLCIKFRESGTTCKIHKMYDKSVKNGCNICK